MRPRPAGFWSAVQFLTRIPLPWQATGLEGALVWFPLVGLLLGGLLAVVDLLAGVAAVPRLLTSVITVVAWLMLTGALHADGLMDTSDAVFAHATPERRLEIMRDPRAGTFGVAGLVSIVALKVAALDALPSVLHAGVLMVTPALGRWVIVILATLYPYGREVGLGAPLKASASTKGLLLASLVPLAACAVLWPLGLILGALAAATALLLGEWLMRLLPGLTGDCYGAGCELAEAVVLVAAATLAYALA